MASCHHFPPAVVEMIAVAEESNSLDTVLVDIADGLERRTWRQLDLFVRLLEPLMLLVLASVVLMLAIGGRAYFGRRVATGRTISGREIPPCWNVLANLRWYSLKLEG